MVYLDFQLRIESLEGDGDLHHQNKRVVDRPLFQNDSIRQYRHSSCSSSSISQSRNGSADNQPSTVWTRSTNQTSKRKKSHAKQKGPFDVEGLIRSTVKWHASTGRKRVCCS